MNIDAWPIVAGCTAVTISVKYRLVRGSSIHSPTSAPRFLPPELDACYQHHLHCLRFVMSEAGIGVPLTSCDESRSHRTWSAAFLFALPF
jgi:hypothetical protein